MTITYTWYGHGTHGLEVGSHKLLIDPFFTGNPAASAKAVDVNPGFILISHGHGDHVGDAVAIAKRTGALVISNFEIASWLTARASRTSTRSTWAAVITIPSAI